MIEKVLNEMIAYFGSDVRRINHALKVYGFASAIGRSENLDAQTVQILETAAILHDIGIPVSEKKYGSCIGKYQELEGPPIARTILEKIGIPTIIIERVCFLIGNHHTYTKIDNIDFQILVEADFLVNIFEDEMYSSVKSIGDKYFKTRTGSQILYTMYPQNYG
jgi:HD superfamily phosphodiesterase